MATHGRRRSALTARLAARKQASAGQLLLKAARLFNEEAMARLKERVPAARLAHTTLLPYIDLDGTRATDIARRAGISKQAVGQLVGELVAMKVLRRDRDPLDGRAQLVRFTDAGLAQLVVGIDVLDVIEVELGARVGAMTLDRLRRDLARVLPALEQLAAEDARDEDRDDD